jgi:hypothetical protein
MVKRKRTKGQTTMHKTLHCLLFILTCSLKCFSRYKGNNSFQKTASISNQVGNMQPVFFFFQYSEASSWALSHYCPYWVWQQRCKHMYRYKLKTGWWCDYAMLQLSSPCLKAYREVLSTNGGGSCSISLYCLERRNVCTATI